MNRKITKESIEECFNIIAMNGGPKAILSEMNSAKLDNVNQKTEPPRSSRAAPPIPNAPSLPSRLPSSSHVSELKADSFISFNNTNETTECIPPLESDVNMIIQ